MNKNPPKAMLTDAMPQASPDKLDKARDAVRRVRDLKSEKEDAERRVKEIGAAIQELEHKELPELFDDAKIKGLELAAEGNQPAFVAKVQSYYRVNIAADWPDEKRGEAFAWLAKNGHEGMIKTVITIELGLGQRAVAKKVQAALKKLKVGYSASMGVPWNTLTAFVREQIEEKQAPVPLDTLGATVGRVVRLTKPK